MDAVHEMTSGDGDSGLTARKAILFQSGEDFSVLERIPGDGDDGVVAAMFALDANDFRDPPCGGMVEEQAFGQALHGVDEVIVAADVDQFVDQNCFDLFCGKAGEQAERHQD